MTEGSLQRAHAELAEIVAEIEADRRLRKIGDPVVRLTRDKRRLVLEREIAAAAGDEYADELQVGLPIGDEWHVVSNFGRETVVFCGDVGVPTSLLLHFENTEEVRLTGLTDDVNEPSLSGLGVYGLFVVRNSKWTRMVADMPSANDGTSRWLSSLEHFVLRSKGGQLSCLARGYDWCSIPEAIEAVRERAIFWREFSRPVGPDPG